MITKILPPTKNREINYDNRGSSARLVNYFEHEAKESNQTGYYFSQDQEGYTADEVVSCIDQNIKGLKSDDTKFVSLVISPSVEELEHINNNIEKLKEYTRNVMDNYARNFKLKGDKQLKGSDLVWYGIIHGTRKHQWNDKDVKEGKVQAGEGKRGAQTHVHVIISTRDQEQKITLNPKTSKARFNIVNFQKKNGETFQKQFDYKKQTQYHKEKPNKERNHIDQARYFEKRVNAIAVKYDLDKKTVQDIRSKALYSGYSQEFYKGLKDYTKRLDQKGEKRDLKEFDNLPKSETRLNRQFPHSQVHQRQQVERTQHIDYAVKSILYGAGETKDDDRAILKDLSDKRGGSLGL